MNQVSIIIPMYNASEHIEECLSSILRQTIKDFEVIMVDDCSTDDSVGKAQKFPFKIIKLKERIPPGQVRNCGVRNTSGDILIFVDADVVLKPNSIEEIISRILGSDTDAVSAIYTPDTPQTNFFSQLQNLILVYRYSKLPKLTTLTCSFFCAIKRSALEAIGGYNEKMVYYEDIEIGHRLSKKGYRCKFDPGLKVTHLKYYSCLSLLSDYFKKAAAVGDYIKHEHFFRKLRENGWPLSLKIASISTGFILLSLILLKVSPIPLFVSLGIQSILIAPVIFYLSKRRNFGFALRSYFIFFGIFLASLFGLAYGVLREDKYKNG